jgi:hypothetical protein
MSQHDYNIANQNAPSFRSDLNNALGAIVTQNSGSSAPATTFANMIWYDTTNKQLKKRNEADSAWIVLGTINETNGTFTATGQPPIASQAEAEAGTDNTKMMTPLRAAQAIAALGSSVDYQPFTSSGTWTKPSGLSTNAIVVVEMWGGGGGGGRSGSSTDNSAGGGGGGAYATRVFLASSLNATESVTVGAGGAGGASNGTSGSAGGNSIFKSTAFLAAYGGGSGNASSGGSQGGNGGTVDGIALWLGDGASDASTDVASTRGTFWGGGGGGAGSSATSGPGAGSLFGSGGGGGAKVTSGSATAGGVSVYGGNGGQGAGGNSGAASGSNGTAPGGGGGAGRANTSGNGARGEVRVWTIG